jgi:MFS family permease
VVTSTTAATPSAGRHPAAPLSPRDRTLSLLAVLVSTVGLGISYGIGYTITSVRFDDWGSPAWLIGLAGAMPSLAVVALIPFAPRLSARLGTVPAMVGGTALVAVTFALMPLLDSPLWWLLLRLLAGAGLALPWLVGETWINTVTTDAVRGRVLAAYTVLLFGSWAGGPLVLERIGTEGTTAYAVGAAAMALAALPLLLARRLAPSLPDQGRFSLRAAVALAPLAMAAALVGGVAEFGAISLLPVWAVDAGLTQAEGLRLLGVLMIGGITLQLGIGWLADRVDRARLLAGLGVALAVAATAAALLVRTGGAGQLAAFILGGVVLGFYAVGLAIIGERVPAGQLAVANAAFLMAYETGAIGGPLLAGAAMDLWPPHGLIAVLAAAGLVFAAAINRAARRRTEVSGELG